MATDDVTRQVQKALKRIQAWPDANQDLPVLLPERAVCSLCYLSGRVPYPNHDLIWVCPHPSVLFVPFSWKEGRLVAGKKYMADKSTFVDLMRVVAERYAGVSQEVTGKWLKLHGAAEQWLEACELAIQALSGFGDEAAALAALRAAVALTDEREG